MQRLKPERLKLHICLLLVALLLAALPAEAKGPALTPKEAKVMIQAETDIVLLDVRKPEEQVKGYYPDSINIPVKELEKRAEEIPAGKIVIIHCAAGVRAKNAVNILRTKRPDLKDIFYIAGSPDFK